MTDRLILSTGCLADWLVVSVSVVSGPGHQWVRGREHRPSAGALAPDWAHTAPRDCEAMPAD